MYTLTYNDLHFEWKDEALTKHGDINNKLCVSCGTRHSMNSKVLTEKQSIKDTIWYALKHGYLSDCKTEEEKKVALLNMLDTKLIHKEIIDWTINYINETIKY